jgi:(1->4)-alpha-D-glucan 1-alpha-D-glucosylmutase
LYADGGREENIAAFALRRNGNAVIAVAPRLFAGLVREGDRAPIGEGVWGEASLGLPEELAGDYENTMTGEKFSAAGKIALAPLLARFPVALLVKTG